MGITVEETGWGEAEEVRSIYVPEVTTHACFRYVPAEWSRSVSAYGAARVLLPIWRERAKFRFRAKNHSVSTAMLNRRAALQRLGLGAAGLPFLPSLQSSEKRQEDGPETTAGYFRLRGEIRFVRS